MGVNEGLRVTWHEQSVVGILLSEMRDKIHVNKQALLQPLASKIVSIVLHKQKPTTKTHTKTTQKHKKKVKQNTIFHLSHLMFLLLMEKASKSNPKELEFG